LNVAAVNAVSVPPTVETNVCSFVPQAASPGASPVSEIVEAELLQLPPTGTVETSLTTTDVGTAGVSVLLIRSLRTDSETKPFGVTGQEQQETICSSGENA